MSDHPRPHPYTVYVEAMQAYVDRRIAETFEQHGLPHPAEITAVIRTLTSVYGSEFRDKYRFHRETQTIQRRTSEGWGTVYPAEEQR